jgi:hypothetical protein
VSNLHHPSHRPRIRAGRAERVEPDDRDHKNAIQDCGITWLYLSQPPALETRKSRSRRDDLTRTATPSLTQASRPSMAVDRLDGLGFMSFSIVGKDFTIEHREVHLLLVIILLLGIFAGKKHLGCIVQAILNCVVTNLPGKKRSSLYSSLETTVCWRIGRSSGPATPPQNTSTWEMFGWLSISLCVTAVGLSLGFNNWIYILLASFGHILTKDRLSATLRHYDLVWLDDRLFSCILWLCISVSLYHGVCLLQSRGTSKALSPALTSSRSESPGLWRMIYLVCLVMVGVGGLTVFDAAFPTPNFRATPNLPVRTPPWEPIVDRKPHFHDFSSCTVWWGTRVVRPGENLDQEQLLSPDLRCTLRLCGGMPKRRLTKNSADSDWTPPGPGPWQRRGDRTHHMTTRSVRPRRVISLTNRQPEDTSNPEIPEHHRIVYELGRVVGEESQFVRDCIRKFHMSTAIQSKCDELERAGHKYLTLVSSHGIGVAAKQDIPLHTQLGYYVGVLYDADHNPPGNHCITGGQIGQVQLELCINASRVPRDLVPGRCMHLLNHSCDPNCTVVSYAPEGWDNDLELLILVAIQEIRQGQPVTFHYRGNMWKPLELLPPTAPPGQRLIACGYNNPCPKRLGRLDYIEPRVRLTPEVRAKWNRGCILDPESTSANLPDMSPRHL